MSNETGIKLVVTNDVHYTYEDDADTRYTTLYSDTRKSVWRKPYMRYEGGQYYLKSPERCWRFPYARRHWRKHMK